MMIREPSVAGRFYPDSPPECRAMLNSCIEQARARAGSEPQTSRQIYGGLVPHAGWICSGAIAARTILEIAGRTPSPTIIIFGAIHVPHGPRASIFPSGAWQTPLGLVHIDNRLSERICGQSGLLEADPHAHEEEHSIEVELPFIQGLMPEARIIPIMVPPAEDARTLGSAIGSACRSYKADVVFLASSDLTHYGPAYRFTPRGVGPEALAWAKDVNDRRMLDLIAALREEAAVEEALTSQNACGPGAIAAMIAACRAMGASRARLLEHTTSYEVLSCIGREPARDAVGYAAMVLD